jgi:hypothetical protein
MHIVRVAVGMLDLKTLGGIQVPGARYVPRAPGMMTVLGYMSSIYPVSNTVLRTAV